MEQRYFLGVAGNIGVGKTHLTRYLGQRLAWEVFYEPVVENPYLDDFYGDMPRWGFHLQVYFLSKRFEMHRKMMDSMLSCIQDRTIYEDAEIFARTLHESGAMDERDFSNYMSLFDCMTSYLHAPNTIIYLRADVDTLLERIAKRGRDCERTIRREYLEQLNRAYDDWAARSAPNMQFLVVDTKGLQRVEEHPAIVKLISQLENHVDPAKLGGSPEPGGSR